MTNFENLGLSETVLKAIEKTGYTTPTEVQAKAIPAIFERKDVLASAQTGTGKTASFVLPMIDLLLQGRTKPRLPRAIIMAPTRELALQVSENITKYARYANLSHTLLIGGASIQKQTNSLNKGCDIIVATPGRLLDTVKRGVIMLKDVKFAVIDEADRMLDMGFIPDIEKIMQMTSPSRQTVMFSATYAESVKKVTQRFLNNPVEILTSRPSSVSETISQYYVESTRKQKLNILKLLLNTQEVDSGIIFCNTKREVDEICRNISHSGYQAAALHGDISQGKRTDCVRKFKSGRIQFLVCSDVAARGIDIPSVSHVFNLGIPFSNDDYVHRIGRTGRAGKSGIAITFVAASEQKKWASIQKMIRQDVEKFQLPIPYEEKVLQDAEYEKECEAERRKPSKSNSRNRRKSAGGRRKPDFNDRARRKETAEKRDSNSVPEFFGWDSKKSDSRSGDNRRSDSRSGDNRRSDSRSGDNRRSDSRSGDNRRSDSRSGDNRRSDSHFGDNRRSDSRSGDNRRSDSRSGDNRRSDSRSSDNRRSDSHFGDNRRSDSRSGDNRRSDSRSGDNRRSDSRSGDNRRSDSHFSDNRRSGDNRNDSNRDGEKRRRPANTNDQSNSFKSKDGQRSNKKSNDSSESPRRRTRSNNNY